MKPIIQESCVEVVTEPLVNSEEMLAKLWCFTQKKNQLSDSWFFLFNEK